ALGALKLISTVMAPLAEDTPLAMLLLGTTALASWGFVGFAAERRHQRLVDAVLAGIVVAVIATTIVRAAKLAVKMLFLDTIKNRSDWRGLLMRFHASGATALHTFVTDEHLRGLPGGIIFSVVMGALCGGVGGAISSWRRRQSTEMHVT